MPLSFGMIGASSIGPEALLDPVARRNDVRVLRVAARRAGAAEAYARAWDIPRATADYEDVVGDPDLDAVYIANAASDHAHWAIRALRSGKHVLCEKPAAVTASAALGVVEAAAAADRVVMEGFHYRFHPLFLTLRRLVGSRRLGELTSVSSVVSGRRAYDPTSILHVAALGGGALLHNGVYAVHWSRLLLDAEPDTVRARHSLNSSGADTDTSAELRFADGRSAHLRCSFERDDPVSLTLSFTAGEVVVTGVIGPHHGHSLLVKPRAGPPTVTTVAGRSSFDYQLEAFIERTGRPPASRVVGRGDDIVANLTVIDAIRRAAISRGTETVGG